MIKQHFMHSLHQPENTKYILILKISIAFLMVLFLSYFSFKNNCGNVELDSKSEQEEEVIEKNKINKFLEYPDICYDVQVFTIVEEKVKIPEKNETEEAIIEETEQNSTNEEQKQDEDDNRSRIIAYIVVGILLISAAKAVLDVLKSMKNHSKDKEQDLQGRCSLVELSLTRHLRRESKLTNGNRRFSSGPRQPSTTPTGPIVHHDNKIIGGRPPPLLRRSSMPVWRAGSLSLAGSPAGSRRPSIDSEDDSSTDRKRIRFIRRY